MKKIIVLLIVSLLTNSISYAQNKYTQEEINAVAKKIEEFATIDLVYDLSKLKRHERVILPFLLQAAEIADSAFWLQSYGSQTELKYRLMNDTLFEFAKMNYGPYERLNNNQAFAKGFREKPLGARFYPSDMTVDEFQELADSNKYSLYTVIRRDETGALFVKNYQEEYSDYAQGIKSQLQEAAMIVGLTDSMFAVYLWERGEAMESLEFEHSDILWLESKNNTLGIIIGPIETYEDQLLGIKTSYEAYVVAKDKEWSKKLQKYVELLPKLQKGLPVDKKYRADLPGLKSQIGAYDALFYAGDCNSGSKTIAVNLPNDEKVQKNYGTRRLQFKNVMRAKFDSILMPISEVLIDSNQRDYINFNAFFSNTMFHEVAHGLGIKNTIEGAVPVTKALGKYYSALEEGKADVLGLYMITELLESGDLTEGSLEEYYTTFVASIFRSVRFGASSAHGKANMVRFNYFIKEGAIIKNSKGTYTVDYDKMKKAVYQLSNIILTIQGEGNIKAAEQLFEEEGVIKKDLQADLDRLRLLEIPVDIKFNQGIDVLENYTKSLKK